MTNPTLQSRILEELSYTDLDTAELARRLDTKIRPLTQTLKEMESAGKVRRVTRGDEEVWEST